MTQRAAIAVLLAIALAGCGSIPKRDSAAPAAPRAGGYYRDDGPDAHPPANLDQVPDAVPKRESLRAGSMRPYTVMGQHYTPMTQLAPYKARGTASWYGRRYHGQRTSSGEIYDMYGMTAAHTVLPIPSYARVTNLANHKSVVVRINDRGPFHSGRLIDLSYTAAYKLGVLADGRALVEVETIMPEARITASTPAISGARETGATGNAGPAARLTPVPDAPASPGATARADTQQPQASPVEAAPQRALAIASDASGVYLQLGAFASQDNADNYLARLRAQVEWLAPALQVYPKDSLFRVHAGPYPDRAEARAAADHISQALGIKAIVLLR